MEKALDEEFKSTVTEMKPHAKKLPQKSSERHRVTQWIKKLLGVKYEKKERNAHAKLLLQQLRTGHLDQPFTDDPPFGLIPMPSPSFPHQPNELDSLLTSVLSPPDLPPPSSRPERVGSYNYQHTSSTTPAREDPIARLGNPLLNTCSLEGDLGMGNTSSRKRPSHRVHYSDSVPYPGDHHSTTSTTGRVPLQGRTLTSLPNGHGGGMTTNDSRYRHRDSASYSPSRRRHNRQPSSTRRDDVMDGRGISRGVDYDTLMLSDLDTSPLNLSNELVGGASYGNLDDDGELSDVSELLKMSPRRRRTKPPAGRQKKSRSPRFKTSSPYHSNLKPSASLSRTSSHSPLKADISREIIQAREVELKLQSAETRFEEEKLMIQKTQEESITKLLDHKNNELEELRSEQHLKVAQLEAQNQRLERNLSHLEREHGHLQETREREAADSRSSSQQMKQQLQADFDKKLSATIAGFERDKLELEQYHSKQLQRLIKENSTRLAKMEDEHKTEMRSKKDLVSRLEARVQEMTRERESLSQANSRLAQDKAVLEQSSSSLENRLQQAQNAVSVLEEEVSAVREEREGQLRQVRGKMEQTAQSLQHQYSIQEAKIREQVTELQHHLSSTREEMEALKTSHLEHIAELEANFQQQWREKDVDHEKKVISLRTELKAVEGEAEEKRVKLEASLSEAREQLIQAKASSELQARQAEKTIEDFKAQVEQQTGAMFEEMQSQVSQLEAELTHTKAKREREVREFNREKREERERREKEREELKQQHEEEVEEMEIGHQRKLERLRNELEDKRESVVSKLNSALNEAEAQAKSKALQSSKVISSLEREVNELRQQIEEERERHELVVSEMNEKAEEERERHEQLVYELREKAEEERENQHRIQESAVSKLKSQLEKQRSQLRQEHRKEVASLIDKHQHKMQELEQDFSLRTAQHNESVSGLQTQLELVQEDMESQQRAHEQQLTDLVSRMEEERASMKDHHQTVIEGLQQDVEGAHSTITQLEERERRLQADHESKVSRMRLQHENTLKGMMPASVKQEYEETIKSLRAQVSILSQRATLLQDELERYYTTNSPTLTHHTGHTPQTNHAPHKRTTNSKLSSSKR